METSITVFETKVDKFSKRFIKDFYPIVIITAIFWVTFIFPEKTELSGIVVLAIITTIALTVGCFYSYKHTCTKIQRITIKDNWFCFEVVKGDNVKQLVIAKQSIGAFLHFEGKGDNTPHLTILNGTEKVIEVYARNWTNRPQQLDEIAYKINVQANA